jgi:hypothetical protein
MAENIVGWENIIRTLLFHTTRRNAQTVMIISVLNIKGRQIEMVLLRYFVRIWFFPYTVSKSIILVI